MAARNIGPSRQALTVGRRKGARGFGWEESASRASGSAAGRD
jgi:hypothetical protein